LKNYIKQNTGLYNKIVGLRQILRVFYNTKTRSRFFWLLRDGDDRLSLDYPLSENSVVFDVGAYVGTFTDKIINKFNCNVYAFEPLKEYSDQLIIKYKDNPKVKIFNFGLLDEDAITYLSNIDGASSIFNRPEGTLDIEVKMKSFENFIKDNKIGKIDLLYMNIEGSEYQLLEQIIESSLIEKIEHLQVQFHNFVANSKELRMRLRKKLEKTHRCVFNFPFIWERWDKLQ
jgi:FkbM family methyltransferase